MAKIYETGFGASIKLNSSAEVFILHVLENELHYFAVLHSLTPLFLFMKRSPLKRKTPMKRSVTSLKRQAIRRVSEKGRIKSLVYAERRKWFLAQPENQICPVMLAIFDERRQTSQVHHVLGRGKYFLDESTWLALSFEGHRWVHDHPAISFERGWMEKK